MTKQGDLKRRVRARMAKTGESYTAARTQSLAIQSLAIQSLVIQGRLSPDRVAAALHVTNGDHTADGLRATGLAQHVLPWRDLLCDGPVPDVPAAALRRLRAAFLFDDDPVKRQECRRWLEYRDRTLTGHRDGEYVLWFEADLYDQLQLVQVLARLGTLRVPPARITLICIGEHVGIAHFGGLGELTPSQLQGLLTSAATLLTPVALDLAAHAWAALRAPDPTSLGAMATTSSQELRFLAEAFDRLSREYPSTRDGLSLSERRILAATGSDVSTAVTAGDVFQRVNAREARPYLGDHLCWRIVARFVQARVPLLAAEPPTTAIPVVAGTRLRLTAAGQQVLRGAADHIAQSGLDRWIGGVHLLGDQAHWRWDEGTESIV